MENITEENILFRKLNKNDRDLFVSLRIIFLTECFNNEIIESNKKQIENSLKIYFDEHIGKNNFIGMVGEYNGNIVSTAYLTVFNYPANPNILDGKIGILLNVYTFPEYRRKGIAKQLIENIIKEAKLIGVNRIDLKATEDGYNLYKQLGFIDDKDKGMGLKM